jgi:hypothetical protein
MHPKSVEETDAILDRYDSAWTLYDVLALALAEARAHQMTSNVEEWGRCLYGAS